jgi:hypothetical protein
MTKLLKIAGVGTLAVLALITALRGDASANDGATCVASTGFIPQFCLNVPVGTSARRETTVPLSTVLTARADVRVEPGIPAPEVVRLADTVDASIVSVERALDRPFGSKPRVLVFATRASFARATQELFGYTHDTAASVAASYGGVFDAATLTIAVSWQSAAGAGLADLIAHELTHLATREILGGAVVPAWFEEGLAARSNAGDAGSDTRLAARSLLANAPRALEHVNTLADWHRAHARLGVALYAASAEAVIAIESAIGREGALALLDQVARGARFEDAYRALSGEDLSAFLARFTGELALRPSVTISNAKNASGDLQWSLSGFAPNADVRVAISGETYGLIYTVRTDGIGMYRGTFGSTAAPGAYILVAQTAKTTATATIDTASR